MLPASALQELQAILLKERGAALSDADAYTQGMALLTLTNTIYRPVKQGWLDGVN
jgi:hypothetical protein